MARLLIKVVPGARRSEIVGMLGARLKVRVSAPPEDGRANDAVCALIAGALGVRTGSVRIAAGHGRAQKSVEIDGLTDDDVHRALAPLKEP